GDAEPRTLTFAVAQGLLCDFRRFCHGSRQAAVTADEDIREIAARSSLIDPELPTTGIGRSMNEFVPIDVTQMPVDARLNEANRYDRVSPPVASQVFAIDQTLAVNERPRTIVATPRLFIASHKPFRELPDCDTSLGPLRVL